MSKEERQKALLARLILARNQLDDAIETINVKGSTWPDCVLKTEPADFIGNGILLTNHGLTLPQEYTLIIFGYDNYWLCADALEQSRRI